MIISERIFKLLEEKEISQIEFSKATGISQSTISDWKRKKTNPSADKILSICDFLKISPYELLQKSGGETEEVDYIVVSKGTDSYKLIVEFEKLDTKQKDRVFGFVSALNLK